MSEGGWRPMRWLRVGVFLVSPAAVWPGVHDSARAQNLPDLAASPFARMMAQPEDADAALDYARAAAEAGQPRAAIVALERVLRTNPKLDNVRLELASLYLAAGSADIAALYAREALASPEIPTDVAVRARQLLVTAEKASSRSLLQTSLSSGFRWDSNATQATALSTVPVFNLNSGSSVLVNPSVKAKPDGSWFSSVQLAHRYDLGLQTEASWETNASLFDQRFFHINHVYDLDVIQADSGPRFGVGKLAGIPLSVRPFFSINYITYGDRPYTALYGGGVSTQAQISPRTTLDLTAIGRFGNYYNSSFRPTTRDYTGPEWTMQATLSFALTASTTISADAYYYWADARQAFFQRQGPGGSISLASEWTGGRYQLGTVVRAGYRRLDYDSPDASINPGKKRADDIVDVGLSVVVPVAERLKVVAQYSYYRQNSSYSIYAFDDNSLSIGLRLDF
jgi:Surface lipoprotein assembly modifier